MQGANPCPAKNKRRIITREIVIIKGWKDFINIRKNTEQKDCKNEIKRDSRDSNPK